MTQNNNKTDVVIVGSTPIGLTILPTISTPICIPTDAQPEKVNISTDSNMTKYLINHVEYPTTYDPFKKGKRKHGTNYTPPKRRHRKK